MMETSKRQQTLSLVLAVVLAFAAILAAPAPAQAWSPQNRTVEVANVDELLVEIAKSREESYTGNIVLTADINFAEFDIDGVKLEEIVKKHGSLTFGDKEHPFKGSFDGQGHYIIGLDYHRNFWKPVANTGLFSFTEDAYIHNIHFRDCYIGADYRGGVLVGKGTRTTIKDVRMENCTLSVTPANNAVSLVTNGGTMGGMIAGELRDHSYMYNCTVQGGRVVNNSVMGISGLGGEGLYLGALVGSAENSEIEYCRVLPSKQYYEDRAINPNVTMFDKDAENNNYKYMTEVYNRYEVAVGAVAGQGVYAGGIVGFVNDTDVVDCFSTAWVHTWVANYVGVGSGNIGYVGGIVAHAKSDKGDNASQVIRCHYASNMESYQWNAVAVIPIIQSNVYLAGLVERDWNEDTGIYNSYFKRNDIVGKDEAIKPHPDGFVRAWGDWLGLNHSGGEHGPSAQGFSYGAIVDDAKYADRLFWEGEGYDFEGDEWRYSTIDPQEDRHINKWIMDDYLGIPVHGDSVKATLDFPGAGDVTISASQLGKAQTTADPYNFAVQGVTANETDLSFAATVNEDRASDPYKMVSDAANNKGFRFRGWYRNPETVVNHIQAGNHAFFDPMVPPEPNGTLVADDMNKPYELVYHAKNAGTGAKDAYMNNDLFVAYYQAQVLFHDVNGNVLDLAGAVSADTSYDWYNHQDLLPVVPEPVDRAGVGDAAKFLGWTTKKNTKGAGGGWPDITTSELNEIKANGQFFEGGESIERPMDLYPVYASLGMNVNVIVEGHELIAGGDTNIRENVAVGKVVSDNGQYKLTIQGYKSDGTLMPEGELPDGYRFLSWYEVELDADGNPVVASTKDGVFLQDWSRWDKHPDENTLEKKTVTANTYKHGLRVSSDPTYVIPADVDLTQKHCYIARFEYRVDYYALNANKPDGNNEKPYVFATSWEPYLGKFADQPGPNFYNWKHDHWTTDRMYGYRGCTTDKKHLAPNQLAAGIASHTLVNGHNVEVGGASYNMDIYTDFPNSAELDTSGMASNGSFTLKARPRPGYRMQGGTWISNDRKQGESRRDYAVVPHDPNATVYDWNIGTMRRGIEYWIEARLVAEVDFMDIIGDKPLKTVTRAYEKYENYNPDTAAYENHYQPLLMNEDKPYTYRYQVRKGLNGVNANPCDSKPEKLTALSEANPSKDEMQAKRPGSVFVGWIDKTAVSEGLMTQAEYDTVYNETTRTAKVSIDAITPYMVTKRELCEHPATLYPVYADYSCDTTTNITRDTALTDPTNPVIDPALKDVAINPDGTKTVTVTADVDPKTAALYDLVSWTIESPEGKVIATIRATDATGAPAQADGTPVGNDNATLKYAIKAGQPYMIVANYRAKADAAIEVTYHTDLRRVEKVSKKGNEPLGKAPDALFGLRGIDKLAGAVLLGWTEQVPVTGDEFHVFDEQNPQLMVDEYTLVTRPMELWPVYRAPRVQVNSNIDDKVGTSHRRFEVETAATPQGVQSSVKLVADEVPGYTFVGWYEDFKGLGANNKVDGMLVTGGRVTGTDMFANKLYTAVYRTGQMNQVVFHFPDLDGTGPMSKYTDVVKVPNGTTFVKTVTAQEPVLGPDGLPTYGPDGTPIMKPVEKPAVVVGGEQTASMENYLNKRDAQAMDKLLFNEWEWRKDDGSVVPWNDFCKREIVGTMHLYPVTHRLNALDHEGNPYGASNLVWQIDPAALANKDVAAPGAKPAVKIAFAPSTLYLGDKLTIHMDEVHYTTDAPVATALNGKLVALYDNFDITTAKELDRKVTGEPTDADPTPGDGNAIFHFENTADLVISKTAPSSAAGSTFTFTVTACNPDGTVEPNAPSTTVMATAKAGADPKAPATVSTSLKVPWGYYKVVETTWGWRYTPSYRYLEGGLLVDGRPANVLLVRSTGTVEVTNALTKGDYLDGEDRVQNVFGQGATHIPGGAKHS